MSAFLRSIKFNVVLFIVIATMAAIGTLLPQMSEDPARVREFIAHHSFWGAVLQQLGLFEVYHHPVFVLLLGLMTFNVVLCKLVNRPPDPGLVPLSTDNDEEDITLQGIRQKPHRLSGTTSEPLDQVITQLKRRFGHHRYRVKRLELAGGAVVLIASRHRFQRWGSYVSHISIVVILLGAMMKSLFGFETFLPISEGTASHITRPARSRFTQRLSDHWRRRSLPTLDAWELWVDRLTVDFYRHSLIPSTYASAVRLYEQSKPLADTTIRVNQPLDVQRVRFYQASWGVTEKIHGAIVRVGNQTLDLKMKEPFPVPGQPWTARIEKYLPDFTIDEEGQPATASLEWKRPALVIGIYNRKQVQLGVMAIGAPSPAAADEEPWGLFFVGGGQLRIQPPFQVLEVRPVFFSGIQVSYDPGYPVMVIGVIAMLLGLSALFYLHQRRVFVYVRAEENGTRVEAGGWSSRSGSGFEREFQSFFRFLKR